MFANDVDSARRTCDKLGIIPISRLEGLQEMSPAFRFCWEHVGGVYFFQRAGDRNITRHGEGTAIAEQGVEKEKS